ncbi:MAG: heavy-metal-associated domain-containing protein [Candidatus Kapabacteria bacterium]|nr:heavy-metal-associated domain-containing protein [Candidatus Kapabacteria bacterium]
MKILVLALAFVFSVSAFAQGSAQAAPENKVTTTFKVFGNCGSCKKKIESPFKNMNGVESASWNKTTKIFTVTYDKSVTTEKKIKEEIAKVGYDSEEVKATDEAYNKLPKCCRYRDGGEEHHD